MRGFHFEYMNVFVGATTECLLMSCSQLCAESYLSGDISFQKEIVFMSRTDFVEW